MARTKAEYNAYMRQYMKKRYEQRFIGAKEARGGKCALCGSSENLEFHHRDPENKEFDVSRIWNKPGSVFEQELEKCDLLCEVCHKKQHSAREKHGTLSCYRYCKCEICRQANAEYKRAWKEKHKHTGI